VGEAEAALFGLTAAARIPLIVLGGKLPLTRHQIDDPFQQADIVPSLRYLAGQTACFDRRQRNIFATPEPRCILHARTDRTNRIYAFCGGSISTIELDGDRTAFIDNPPRDASSIIEEINLDRAFGYDW